MKVGPELAACGNVQFWSQTAAILGNRGRRWQSAPVKPCLLGWDALSALPVVNEFQKGLCACSLPHQLV